MLKFIDRPADDKRHSFKDQIFTLKPINEANVIKEMTMPYSNPTSDTSDKSEDKKSTSLEINSQKLGKESNVEASHSKLLKDVFEEKLLLENEKANADHSFQAKNHDDDIGTDNIKPYENFSNTTDFFESKHGTKKENAVNNDGLNKHKVDDANTLTDDIPLVKSSAREQSNYDISLVVDTIVRNKDKKQTAAELEQFNDLSKVADSQIALSNVAENKFKFGDNKNNVDDNKKLSEYLLSGSDSKILVQNSRKEKLFPVVKDFVENDATVLNKDVNIDTLQEVNLFATNEEDSRENVVDVKFKGSTEIDIEKDEHDGEKQRLISDTANKQPQPEEEDSGENLFLESVSFEVDKLSENIKSNKVGRSEIVTFNKDDNVKIESVLNKHEEIKANLENAQQIDSNNYIKDNNHPLIVTSPISTTNQLVDSTEDNKVLFTQVVQIHKHGKAKVNAENIPQIESDEYIEDDSNLVGESPPSEGNNQIVESVVDSDNEKVDFAQGEKIMRMDKTKVQIADRLLDPLTQKQVSPERTNQLNKQNEIHDVSAQQMQTNINNNLDNEGNLKESIPSSQLFDNVLNLLDSDQFDEAIGFDVANQAPYVAKLKKIVNENLLVNEDLSTTKVNDSVFLVQSEDEMKQNEIESDEDTANTDATSNTNKILHTSTEYQETLQDEITKQEQLQKPAVEGSLGELLHKSDYIDITKTINAAKVKFSNDDKMHEDNIFQDESKESTDNNFGVETIDVEDKEKQGEESNSKNESGPNKIAEQNGVDVENDCLNDDLKQTNQNTVTTPSLGSSHHDTAQYLDDNNKLQLEHKAESNAISKSIDMTKATVDEIYKQEKIDVMIEISDYRAEIIHKTKSQIETTHGKDELDIKDAEDNQVNDEKQSVTEKSFDIKLAHKKNNLRNGDEPETIGSSNQLHKTVAGDKVITKHEEMDQIGSDGKVKQIVEDTLNRILDGEGTVVSLQEVGAKEDCDNTSLMKIKNVEPKNNLINKNVNALPQDEKKSVPGRDHVSFITTSTLDEKNLLNAHEIEIPEFQKLPEHHEVKTDQTLEDVDQLNYIRAEETFFKQKSSLKTTSSIADRQSDEKNLLNAHEIEIPEFQKLPEHHEVETDQTLEDVDQLKYIRAEETFFEQKSSLKTTSSIADRQSDIKLQGEKKSMVDPMTSMKYFVDQVKKDELVENLGSHLVVNGSGISAVNLNDIKKDVKSMQVDRDLYTKLKKLSSQLNLLKANNSLIICNISDAISTLRNEIADLIVEIKLSKSVLNSSSFESVEHKTKSLKQQFTIFENALNDFKVMNNTVEADEIKPNSQDLHKKLKIVNAEIEEYYQNQLQLMKITVHLDEELRKIKEVKKMLAKMKEYSIRFSEDYASRLQFEIEQKAMVDNHALLATEQEAKRIRHKLRSLDEQLQDISFSNKDFIKSLVTEAELLKQRLSALENKVKEKKEVEEKHKAFTDLMQLEIKERISSLESELKRRKDNEAALYAVQNEAAALKEKLINLNQEVSAVVSKHDRELVSHFKAIENEFFSRKSGESEKLSKLQVETAMLYKKIETMEEVLQHNQDTSAALQLAEIESIKKQLNSLESDLRDKKPFHDQIAEASIKQEEVLQKKIDLINIQLQDMALQEKNTREAHDLLHQLMDRVTSLENQSKEAEKFGFTDTINKEELLNVLKGQMKENEDILKEMWELALSKQKSMKDGKSILNITYPGMDKRDPSTHIEEAGT